MDKSTLKRETCGESIKLSTTSISWPQHNNYEEGLEYIQEKTNSYTKIYCINNFYLTVNTIRYRFIIHRKLTNLSQIDMQDYKFRDIEKTFTKGILYIHK